MKDSKGRPFIPAPAWATERIADLEAENAALLKQWNDLDQRTERQHREWNAKMVDLEAKVGKLRKENARMAAALISLIEYARESASLTAGTEHARLLTKWADAGEAAKAAGGGR